MISASRSIATTATLLSHKTSPLQTWFRSASTKHTQKFEPLTIPYASLNKTIQASMRSLQRWDRAFIGSGLVGASGFAWITYYPPESFSLIMTVVLGLASFPIIAAVGEDRSDTLAKDALKSLSTLSENPATQEKINRLKEAPFLSIAANSSRIEITPIVNGDTISASKISIPPYMLKPKVTSLQETLKNVKTPEAAIKALVLQKHLKGCSNPLKKWSDTSRISISMDKRKNLSLDNTYSTELNAIKIGNWKDLPDFPESHN